MSSDNKLHLTISIPRSGISDLTVIYCSSMEWLDMVDAARHKHVPGLQLQYLTGPRGGNNLIMGITRLAVKLPWIDTSSAIRFPLLDVKLSTYDCSPQKTAIPTSHWYPPFDCKLSVQFTRCVQAGTYPYKMEKRIGSAPDCAGPYIDFGACETHAQVLQSAQRCFISAYCFVTSTSAHCNTYASWLQLCHSQDFSHRLEFSVSYHLNGIFCFKSA